MISLNERFSEPKKIAIDTLMTLVFLTLMKILTGYFTKSIALLADGFHSLSDVLIAGIAFMVVRLLSKKPSERFPYGYYKLEDLATLLISFIFSLVAVGIIYESIIRITRGSIISVRIDLASAIAFLSALISYIIAHKQEKVASKYNISSLQLNAREMKYDSLSSILVGFSIILSHYIQLPLEEVISIIIALLIIRISIIGVKGSVLDLLDAWSKPEIIAKIRTILETFSDVKDIKSIRIRKAGPLIFGDIIIGVAPGLNIEQVHTITDSIERKLRDEIPELSDMVIHAEPMEPRELRVCVPVIKAGENEFEISDHFGKAPLIAFIKIDKMKRIYEIETIKKNEFVKMDKHAGVKLAKNLGECGVDAVIVRNIGEASFLSLKAYNVRIFKTKSRSLREAIEDLLNDNLIELHAPTK